MCWPRVILLASEHACSGNRNIVTHAVTNKGSPFPCLVSKMKNMKKKVST